MGNPWELPVLNSSAMQGERVRNECELRGEPSIRPAAPIGRLPRPQEGSPMLFGSNFTFANSWPMYLPLFVLIGGFRYQPF